jgi:hypothetical protein
LHPQDVLLMHCDPSGLPEQSTQRAPHPVADPTGWHVPFVEQHVPPPHIPSPGFAHDPVQAPALHVGFPFAHAVQALPSPPHASFARPATHSPASGSQQPPLHGLFVAPPQEVPQVCVDVLHAFPAGQSACELHPHAPLTHVVPAVLPAQLTQFGPHAAAFSGMQALLTQQLPAPHMASPG